MFNNFELQKMKKKKYFLDLSKKRDVDLKITVSRMKKKG